MCMCMVKVRIRGGPDQRKMLVAVLKGVHVANDLKLHIRTLYTHASP